MGFHGNILELEAQLSKTQERQNTLVALAQTLIKSMDWSDFKRSDILSFISNQLPKQHYGPYSFGQFNLTLASQDHFSIQIYFMEGVPTEIHSHAFHGYFHYLEGNVLQTKFKKKNGEKINDKVYKNAIEVESEKILHQGEGELITPGPIHQILRLSNISTVLMVMAHPFEKRESELILPSGHLIKGHHPSDEFFRYITLLAANPELEAQILPLLKLEDLLLYCFRNSMINHTKSMDSHYHQLLSQLKKMIPVEEILNSFEGLRRKELKMKKIGMIT